MYPTAHLPTAIILLGLVLAGCATAKAAPGDQTEYRIDLTLDPVAAQMEVDVRIYLTVDDPTAPLEFLLHSDLSIASVEGPEVVGTEVTPEFNPFGLPESHISLVAVELVEGVAAGDRVELRWRYQGWIPSEHVQLGADALHPEWVELDMGSLWLPIRVTLTEAFTYQAQVAVPQGYEVVGAGDSARDGQTWSFVTEQPHLTASLAVAPAMHTNVLTGDVRITIHNPGRASGADLLAERSAAATGLFVERFGPLLHESEIEIVLPPDLRGRPEGYARDRYVMMVHDMDAGPRRFGVAAHEIAHLWWHRAPTQGPTNFLNESFAEYASWIALCEVFGPGAFEERLEAAREASEGVGSIRDWTPETNGPLVYAHGPLLLHGLRHRVGDDAFFSLLREIHETQLTTIDGFLSLMEARTDMETFQWLTEAF